jgi:hypothetical protein
LVSCAGQHVPFGSGTPRDLDERGPPRQAELTLSVEECLRRWSEPVPLPGVHTVRTWGRYASTPRPKLAHGRAQLPEQETPPLRPSEAATAAPPDRDRPWEQGPGWHHAMVVIQVLARGGAPPALVPRPEAA